MNGKLNSIINVTVLGDSLPESSKKLSFFKYLRRNPSLEIEDCLYKAMPLKDLNKKVRSFVRSENLKKSDVIVFAGGISDVYCPWKASVKRSSALFGLKHPVKKHYCLYHDDFYRNYEEIVARLVKTDKTVVLVTLPVLEIAGFDYTLRADRNSMILSIAARYNVEVVDIEGLSPDVPNIFDFSPVQAKKGVKTTTPLERLIPSLSSSKGKRRKLNYTTDGLHLNEKSCMNLAEAVCQKIREVSVLAPVASFPDDSQAV